MHRSRLGVILIDTPREGFEPVAQFWRAALGGSRTTSRDGVYDEITRLPGGVEVALQRLGDGAAPRVHLDIETDDVRAEIARLVAAGGKVSHDRDDYAIMAAPDGQPFCVVPVQSDAADFDAHATTWA